MIKTKHIIINKFIILFNIRSYYINIRNPKFKLIEPINNIINTILYFLHVIISVILKFK
jgi:hypothetical protein